MNEYEMIVVIVFIVMLGSVIRAALKHNRDRRGSAPAAGDKAEASRLREEVAQLKDRLAVLERIAVEKENSLEREFERLRDR